MLYQLFKSYCFSKFIIGITDKERQYLNELNNA